MRCAYSRLCRRSGIDEIRYKALETRSTHLKSMSTVTLHPLLRYSQHDIEPGHCCSILWDLREPPMTSIRHVSALSIPIPRFDVSQHATSPSIILMYITCELLPTNSPLIIENPLGITILDVLDAIYSRMQTPLKLEDWDKMSQKHRDRISNVFDARWRVSMDPMGIRAKGVLLIDCVLLHTWFAGLSLSPLADSTCILTLRRPK